MLNSAATSKKRPLDLWDKIEIVIEQDDHKGLYITRVEDIKPGAIVASQPEFVEGNRLLTANATVFVQFRKPDAMYRFPAKITSISGRGGDKIVLRPIGRTERVQRRNFVRIDMKVDIKFSRLKIANRSAGLMPPCWQDSFSKNVSAGGMLIQVVEEIEKGDILIIRLGGQNLTGLPRLLTVVCCRIVEIDNNRFAGVEFIKREKLAGYFTPEELSGLPSQITCFDSRLQNKIVRFIFEQQLKERQKGLI